MAGFCNNGNFGGLLHDRMLKICIILSGFEDFLIFPSVYRFLNPEVHIIAHTLRKFQLKFLLLPSAIAKALPLQYLLLHSPSSIPPPRTT